MTMLDSRLARLGLSIGWRGAVLFRWPAARGSLTCEVVASEQLFRIDRQVANALAGGMEDGVHHGRASPGDPDLSNAARPYRIQFVIRNVDRRYVDFGNVRVHGHMVVRQIGVYETA